jgi:hypothetical protein
MNDKPPSERQQIAQRIATFIIENHLANPFGGEVDQSASKGRPYTVAFAVPRLLDGIVTVYGPKFILINMQGRLARRDGAVFESEQNAIQFLRLLLVEHKEDAALAVPAKPPKARE